MRWLRLLCIGIMVTSVAALSARHRRRASASGPTQVSNKVSGSLNEQLEQTIERYSRGNRQLFGVAAISVRTDSLIMAHNAALPMVPASNQKLLTTSAAWRFWDDALVASLRRRLGRWGVLYRAAPARSVASGRRRAAPQRARKPKVTAADTTRIVFPEGDSVTGLPGFDLLCRIHKQSDNRAANRLLDCLAARLAEKPDGIIQHYLDSVGCWHGGLNIVDGCGRSPANRAAPLTLAQLLVADRKAPRFDAFLRSMAVAGRDGTLRRHDLSAGSRVRAKTGSINGTYSLSGYLLRQQDTIAFSAIINRCYSKQAAFGFFTDMIRILDAGSLVTDGNIAKLTEIRADAETREPVTEMAASDVLTKDLTSPGK